MRRTHVHVAAFLLAVAGPACGGGGGSPSPPTQPSPPPGPSAPVNLTGTWSGPASDSSGPGRMTWQITHEGTAFSGTLTMIETGSNRGGRGSVSGAVSGSSISFSINVPVAGFDSPYEACSASVSGDGQASSSAITGGYSGSNSCAGAITSGQLTLARQ